VQFNPQLIHIGAALHSGFTGKAEQIYTTSTEICGFFFIHLASSFRGEKAQCQQY
jgi:hypothetical protein